MLNETTVQLLNNVALIIIVNIMSLLLLLLVQHLGVMLTMRVLHQYLLLLLDIMLLNIMLQINLLLIYVLLLLLLLLSLHRVNRLLMQRTGVMLLRQMIIGNDVLRLSLILLTMQHLDLLMLNRLLIRHSVHVHAPLIYCQCVSHQHAAHTMGMQFLLGISNSAQARASTVDRLMIHLLIYLLKLGITHSSRPRL